MVCGLKHLNENRKMETEIKYPAECVAHWSTGATNCCMKHAQQLVSLGNFMGLHVPLTKLDEPAECGNCVNEAKDKKK